MIYDNILKLPGNNKTGIEEFERPRFKELLPKHLLLKALKLKNIGNKTAILCSNTDGHGIYSAEENKEFSLAGLVHYVKTENSILFMDATSKDLKKIIQDPEYKNIFLIGHSSYHSWCASDKPVDWYDVGKMVKFHLKKGIFANFGCGAIHSWNQIPLGYFVVNNPENLFGKDAEYIYSEEINDFSRLRKLKRMPSLEFLIQ